MIRQLRIFVAEPGSSVFGKDDDAAFTPAEARVPEHSLTLYSPDDDDAQASAERELLAWLKARRWDDARWTLALCTDGDLAATVHPSEARHAGARSG